jgi:hypothetical protein
VPLQNEAHLRQAIEKLLADNGVTKAAPVAPKSAAPAAGAAPASGATKKPLSSN